MICKRPIVRYFGGKWKLAPWIISNMPSHRVYVESFGGGGSVLLRKPKEGMEVYNDLDGEIVNVFKVARDMGSELVRALELTPYSRREYELSYQDSDDPLERARRTVLRSFYGFGGTAVFGRATGFRGASRLAANVPAHQWCNYPSALMDTVERLRGVVIENRDAFDVMRNHDSATTLHYVDPPYVHSTRGGKARYKGAQKVYKHEMTDRQHIELARVLRSLKGIVLLSGYRCELYDKLYSGWRRVDRIALAEGAAKRVESLWINRKGGRR